MDRAPAGIATALTALLLLSIIGSVALENIPTSAVLDEPSREVQQTSARSTSAEIFLASGGSSSHDEFSGGIAASDTGYVVGGDVNSSAQAVTFAPHTYVPSSPFTNGNEFSDKFPCLQRFNLTVSLHKRTLLETGCGPKGSKPFQIQAPIPVFPKPLLSTKSAMSSSQAISQVRRTLVVHPSTFQTLRSSLRNLTEQTVRSSGWSLEVALALRK
jgi:hypothetical protein